MFRTSENLRKETVVQLREIAEGMEEDSAQTPFRILRVIGLHAACPSPGFGTRELQLIGNSPALVTTR